MASMAVVGWWHCVSPVAPLVHGGQSGPQGLRLGRQGPHVSSWKGQQSRGGSGPWVCGCQDCGRSSLERRRWRERPGEHSVLEQVFVWPSCPGGARSRWEEHRKRRSSVGEEPRRPVPTGSGLSQSAEPPDGVVGIFTSLGMSTWHFPSGCCWPRVLATCAIAD